MKLYNRVQVLDNGELRLRFNRRLAASIGVKTGVTLYGLALEDFDADDPSRPWDHPSLVLVLSPFPIKSWQNLIRVSITVRPEADGALHQTLEDLKKQFIYCRHFESTKSTDLYNYRLHTAEGEFPRLARGRSDLIIPTTDMTLELPTLKRVERKATELECEDGRNLIDLHKALRGAIELPDCARAEMEAREELVKCLTSKGARVDWVSPLRTLNRLGKSSTFANTVVAKSGDTREADHEPAAVHREAELLRERRSRIRKKLIVEEDRTDESNPFSISIDPWAEPIWHRRKTIPDIIPARHGEPRLAHGYADAGEKLICWDIFNPTRAVLIAIELLVPTGGYEHAWWEWALDRVRLAGGSILTCHTSARLDGEWGTFEAVVVFPLKESAQMDGGQVPADQKGMVHGQKKTILHFLRILQGYEAGTVEFKKFCENLRPKEGGVGIPQGESSPEDARFESTLHFHNTWDLRGFLADDDKRSVLTKNPFTFTNALSLRPYQELYEQWRESSRWQTAVQICERLICNKENTLIIGAHRSGKTTLLRLVKEAINRKDEHTGQQPLWVESGRNDLKESKIVALAVQVDAGSTMPFSIFPLVVQVVRKLGQWADKEAGKAKALLSYFRDCLNPAGKSITKSFKKLRLSLGLASVEIGTTTVASELARIGGRLEAIGKLNLEEKRKYLVWEGGTTSGLQLAELVAESVETLEQFLKILNTVLYCQFVAIVIIDEFERFGNVGDEHFLRAWRDVVEREDNSIVWLVSSVRSTDEGSRLQPLSGVFREWILGPLDQDDCEHLLDRFTGVSRSLNADPTGDRYIYSYKEGDDAELRPVLTFLARGFIRKMSARLPYFMQVFLLHLFEESGEQVLPVINRKACESVLFSKVLPELSDYLAEQWKQVPADIHQEIEQELRRCPEDPQQFVRSFGVHLSEAYPAPAASRLHQLCGASPEDILRPDLERYSARARLVMQRVGLSGGAEAILAPVVAVWLLERRIRAAS